MRAATWGCVVVLTLALGLAACSNGVASAPSADDTVRDVTSDPSPPPAASPSQPSAVADQDIPFEGAGGNARIVAVEWGESLASAEGFAAEPPRLGARGTYRDEASGCTTELIQVLPELSAGDDARAASDDGIRWLTEQLKPGSSEGIDAYIGDSRVDREGGGKVAVRVAAVAWEDRSNAIMGARAFPELDLAVLFLVTCPATSSSRDEIQELALAGHLDLIVGVRRG